MPPRVWIHLTAKLSLGMPDLTRDESATWVWPRMRAAFPETIAAILMPDHPHLLLASEDPEGDRHRLARLLGQLGRRLGVRGRASTVADVQIVLPGQKLARAVRYIALNPCRRRLASCPLAWSWSTHRDVVGASVDPWVTADRLAVALARTTDDFAARHHAYVSGDPHADVRGTPLPVAAASTRVPADPLATVIDAATAALRAPLDAVRRVGPARNLFVALARDQGWTNVAQLADAASCSVDTIYRANVDAAALGAARVCLGDARLRRRR